MICSTWLKTVNSELHTKELLLILTLGGLGGGGAGLLELCASGEGATTPPPMWGTELLRG